MKPGPALLVHYLTSLLLLFSPAFHHHTYGQSGQIDTQSIESMYDLNFTKAERDSFQTILADYQKLFRLLHEKPLKNSTPMALVFDPVPIGFEIETKQLPMDWSLPASVVLPANKEELAFLPVYKLSVLIRTRKITSLELTQIYLRRLKRYADTLQCAITILEQSAIKQAQIADQEISKGKYRGPLHGIPYGIKDLLTVEGTETTWGAAPYKGQVITETATVVKKLGAAGAVLIVKLTLGALAMGDIWYGGVTKNPWNLKQGSSGSSAGSAASTVAGLVAFAIGTETLGSIVSPATRCGATGLRPSFGRVSRTGAMALSWSMDKIGPICRSAVDCAIVFDAIRGKDDIDHHVSSAPFNYQQKSIDIRKLRVGYIKSYFEATSPSKENDNKVLDVFRSMGLELHPVEMNLSVPVSAIRFMLTAEAAAAFDELTRSNRDSLLTDQRKNAWPNTFRGARFIPAVDYINASRQRYELVQEFHRLIKDYDVIISPSFGGNQLLVTNLTGTPCLVMPDGYNDQRTPTSISLLGKLYGEAPLIALARAYQEATAWEDNIPPLFKP
ncbi:MAG: amidase [Bacteroidetes bacterium]|nr:amidase [Bacteroidota bacterium]